MLQLVTLHLISMITVHHLLIFVSPQIMSADEIIQKMIDHMTNPTNESHLRIQAGKYEMSHG